MTRRLFPDNDGWTTEASRAANNATVGFMDLLAILEEDGPVDLKDFHFIVTHAIGSFVAGLSVTRRLGDPADPPNPIVRSYPRLIPKYDDEEPILLKNKFVYHPADVPQALALEKRMKDFED